MTHKDPPHALPFYTLVGWLAATMAWWAMAFARLPGTSPEWLLRAREICFGTVDNGLPDADGWLSLTGPPLGMLATLVVIWGPGLGQDLRRRWRRPAWRAVLAGLVALPLAGGVWVGMRVADGLERGEAWRPDWTAAEAPMPETYPRLDRPAPAFALVDQHGERVSLADFEGRVAYVTFAFGHCSTICPLTVQNVLAGARELSPTPPVLILTLDPWRDTVHAVEAVAEKWSLGETGRILTGPVEKVNAVLDEWGISRERDLKTGDITHPPLVYVLDPGGRIAYALTEPSAGWVAEAGRRAAASASGELAAR